MRNGEFVRETRITVSEDATIEDDGLPLNLSLAPREERLVSFGIAPHSDQHDRAHIARRRAGSFEERREALEIWTAAAPSLRTSDDTLRHVHERSLRELAELRFYPHIASQDVSLPAVRLPWFITLLVRDSPLPGAALPPPNWHARRSRRWQPDRGR
jgi:hypothetical protein